MSKKAFFFGALTLLFAFGFSVEVDAQYSRRPFKRLARWTGEGAGHGIHWQRKGPDIGYYNPYSSHNSHLVTAIAFDTTGYDAAGYGQIATEQEIFPAMFQPAMIHEPAQIYGSTNNSFYQQQTAPSGYIPQQTWNHQRPYNRPVNSTTQGEVQAIPPRNDST